MAVKFNIIFSIICRYLYFRRKECDESGWLHCSDTT